MTVALLPAGYVSLPDAAAYLGRNPRWLRRRLDQVVHFRVPGGQPLLRIVDLDAWVGRFRQEPSRPATSPRALLDGILGPKKPRKASLAQVDKQNHAKQ